MWSGTQFNLKAFEGQRNEAARAGWTTIGQLEECPDTKRQHYQFAVKTPQVRMSQVRKMFCGAHIEEARNKAALEQYVNKEETRIGDMPKVSELYPTLDQYWTLIYETLIMGSTDKNFRVVPVERTHWYRDTMSKDQILAALDYASAELIESGYRVETHAVNPQVRSAFAKFSTSLFKRAYADRQTDRQTRISSQVEIIPNVREDTQESTGEDTQSEQEIDESGSGDSGSGNSSSLGSSEGASEVDSIESGAD
jgi:hypothetical protein